MVIQVEPGENSGCCLKHSLEHGVSALCFLQDDKQHGSRFHTNIHGLIEEELHPPQLVIYGVYDSDGCCGGNRAWLIGESWLHFMTCEERRGHIC